MEKGKTNNPNGRPKGTPNKVTKTVRGFIVELINSNQKQIAEDLEKLNPKERLELLVKLLPYILPKVQTAEEVEGGAYTTEDIGNDWDMQVAARCVKKWYEK